MNLPSYPADAPDRDSLPLKKRDQRPSPPPQHPQCDSAIFKAPYPYKRHTSPFQPVPRRVPQLYQPWTHTSGRTKPHFLSAFRDYPNWTEWNESGWSLPHLYQQQTHLSAHMNYPRNASTLRPASLETPHNGSFWEDRLQHTSLTTEKERNGRTKELYVRRKDRKQDLSTVENRLLLSSRFPQSVDFAFQHHQLHKPTKTQRHSILKVPSCENLEERTSVPTPQHSNGHISSSSPNLFPWLLPHFEAGSLIELRDGRLRRVEHLQTEDFLLGSLACPDLRLSCCTVQRITPSAQTPSISRLLILLHDQQSQELVDVYVEYPLFVRERGWSSCSPQRTARLCGLQCRQLSVGDVCLALTPVSAPRLPVSVVQEPETPPGRTDRCEVSLLPSGTEISATGKRKGPEGGRRRHNSAPELRRPGANCTENTGLQPFY